MIKLERLFDILPVWVRICRVNNDGRSNAFGHISHCHIRRSFCLFANIDVDDDESVFVNEWRGGRLLFVDDDDARIWSIINDMIVCQNFSKRDQVCLCELCQNEHNIT